MPDEHRRSQSKQPAGRHNGQSNGGEGSCKIRLFQVIGKENWKARNTEYCPATGEGTDAPATQGGAG